MEFSEEKVIQMKLDVILALFERTAKGNGIVHTVDAITSLIFELTRL